MKKVICLINVLIFFALGSYAAASVIDSPHNETHGISCGDCHTYSLWWQYSPAANNSTTPYSSITAAVCNKCHGSGGYAPNKVSHSSASMGSMHDKNLGDWSTNCVDCHDPHFQEQLGWLSTDEAALYLVNGSIDSGSIQVDTTANTTTFTYNNADSSTFWPAPATWGAKTSQGRGLILVLSKNNPGNTYEINSAAQTTAITPGTPGGTGSITVQGIIPSSYDGSTFGIIYGQLIKKTITTPRLDANNKKINMDVKFFDPNITYASGEVGGLADGSGLPPKGICQVCHASTKYYNYDGLQPDPADPNYPNGARIAVSTHYKGKCTACHVTLLGFKPSYPNHNVFISGAGTSCVNCHNATDIIANTHKFHCGDCHYPGPPTLISPFPSPKWPTPAGAVRQTGTCYDCHSGIAADFTSHPNALDHTGHVDPNPRCTGCHFHSNKNVITGIHVTKVCATCHNLTYDTTTGKYSGNGALINLAAQHGPGDCTNCHTDIAANFFAHPTSGDHTGLVTATTQCAVCHTGDPVKSVHNSNCGMCHANKTGLLYGIAKTNGPGDCLNCHSTYSDFSSHNPPPHTSQVSAGAACVNCHSNPDLINGIHGRNGCATCHDSKGVLVGSATGHNGGGKCSVCHNTEATDLSGGTHPAASHSSTIVTFMVGSSCVTCHSGDPVSTVHNNNCLDCHVALNSTQIHTLKGSAAGREGNTTNTCVDCHTAIASSFNNHNAWSHSVRVSSTGTSCASCHPGDPIFTIHQKGGYCVDCHASNDWRLIGNAAGKGTGKPAVKGNNCMNCHGGFPLHDSLTIDLSHSTQVTATPTCITSGCHDQMSDLGANIYVGSNSVHTSGTYAGTDSCAACHLSDGSLNPPAIVGGGDCKTCHSDAKYDSTPH